jgi:hypothetical protein
MQINTQRDIPESVTMEEMSILTRQNGSVKIGHWKLLALIQLSGE